MTWECKHCLKEFKQETSFMKHRCPQMEKSEEIKGARGQAAFALYSSWMQAYNRKVPDIETFTTSRYFNTFVKFADHVKHIQLASPETFIRLMKEKDISPMLWTRNECYSIYLEWYDRRSNPMDQAKITIDTLFKVADAADISTSDVFEAMHPREIMQFIRLRKLSPWILLCSKKFKDVVSHMDTTDRDELLNVIGYNYWAEKFEKNPHVVEQMKVIASEMGI